MKRYLVLFKDQKNKEIIERYGAKIIQEFDYIPKVVLIECNEIVYEHLKECDEIKSIQEDVEDEFDEDEESNEQKESYAIGMLKAHEFWKRGYRGKGIKIAVLDSGCQEHEDLNIAGGYNAYDPSQPYMRDFKGHGTHVTGIINMQDNGIGYVGIATDADVYVVKLDDNQGGSSSRSSQVAGVNWAIANKMDIISMSISSATDDPARREAFRSAAEDHGIICVTSAGNNQRNIPLTENTINFPAAYPFVIAVGNLDESKERFVSSSVGHDLSISAPGTRIISTCHDPDNLDGISRKYCSKNGTSMSTPFVAGMFALYRQVFPHYSREELTQKVFDDTEHLGDKRQYGAGLIQPPSEFKWIPEGFRPIEERGIIVRDSQMRKIAILENAYDISIERRVNEIWVASFKLPADDPKNNLCRHFNYIEIVSPSGRYMGMYRIMPTETRKAVQTNRITYKLEHVLATLMDDVIDGYHQFTNLKTSEVIKHILELQSVKHWVFVGSEIERYFHYKFENENGLLGPILSVPKLFDEPYMFNFNTQVYPFELSLVKSTDDIIGEIRWGKDMVDFEEVSDPSNIVNYIIPKGAGEGVNQLDIKDVNDGKNYLKDDKSIEKWGVHKYIWIDRSFTVASSLKESAKALLDQWKEPKISFKTKSINLTFLPEYEHEKKRLNGLINIFVVHAIHKARIISEKIPDLNKEWDVEYEINNKLNDVAKTQTDLQRKQQVNEAYSQGATNILNFTYQDNADSEIPATIPFYIDDDVVNINTVELTFRTRRFRAYSQATKGGGALVKSTGGGGGTVKSTSSGGGSTATSSSGGGVVKSTDTGGGTSRTSAAGGDHRHVMFRVVGYEGNSQPNTNAIAGAFGGSLRLPGDTAAGEYVTDSSSGNHTHNFTYPAHSHEFSTPNHTHDISIPNHTHDIDLPNHTHEIELPNHTHEVEHKIVELSTLPTSVTIKVDGNIVPHTSISGNRINLADYMSRDSGGKITRGRHEVEILPNGLARIEADLILRVFIQSHLGGVY